MLKRFFYELMLEIAASPILTSPNRIWIYRLLGMKVEQGASIAAGCHFSPAVCLDNISIGENTVIGYGCYFEASAAITIEKNVGIEQFTHVLTTSHDIGWHDRRFGYNQYRPVIVGEGSWIGVDCTILPGVEIGKGCVIGSGAIVSLSCRSDEMYSGVPAKFARYLDVVG